MASATGMAFAYHTIKKSELQGRCREEKRAGLGETVMLLRGRRPSPTRRQALA